MFKKIGSILVVLVLMLGLVGCQTSSNKGDKLVVYTTLFPLYDFAKQVGGDNVEVHLLLPNDADGHGYEPSAKDIIAIKEADLFIYTNEEMEPWVANLLPELKDVEVVNASTSVNWLTFNEEEHEEHEEHEEEHEEDNHTGRDPHVWMDLENAQSMVQTISDAMVEVDSEHQSIYETNTKAYINELSQLDESFKTMVDSAKHDTIVFAGHFALGYLMHRYDLHYVAAYKSGGELTPSAMTSMIETLKEHQLTTIFHEENIEPTIAKAMANETGAKLLVLHGLHNVSKDELNEGVSYLSLMKQNLENLKVGLNETP